MALGLNRTRIKSATQGIVLLALGVSGIYAAECLECWQPHGVLLSWACVALVLLSMCLALLSISRFARPRDEEHEEEREMHDPHFDAALDQWSWVGSLHGACLIALVPIAIYQLLRSSPAYLPLSFLGGMLLVMCARLYCPKLIHRWRAVIGESSPRSTVLRLFAASCISILITTITCVLLWRWISVQPVVGLVSSIIGLVGTTSAAFLAGYTDKTAQQCVQPDRREDAAPG
jgi:hypothetical protein